LFQVFMTICDINTATELELVRALRVTMGQAYELTLWRPYDSWDEVAQLPGFDRSLVLRLLGAGAAISRNDGDVHAAASLVILH
jgi:hypothetical protein